MTFTPKVFIGLTETVISIRKGPGTEPAKMDKIQRIFCLV